MSKTLEFKQQVKASPEAAYRAFSRSAGFYEWLCDGANVNAQEGGRVLLWWNDGYQVQGRYTILEENKRVAFIWQGYDDPGRTTVEVTFAEQDGGTLITLTYGDIGAGDEWATFTAEIEKGWQIGFENLASMLETGIDLRIAHRPLLGFIPGALISAENAERYQLPADTKGNVIVDLLPGMGAEAAGLQPDDVLHSINGVVIENFNAYAPALAGKQAGDEVAVAYYRAGKLNTVQMALSARPMPEVPADPKKLAEGVKAVFDQVFAELDELLDGVSEDAASKRPAEGEWSVKEIIGHLILSERTVGIYITSLMSDNEMVNFPNNQQAQLDGLLASYPTLDALRAEFRRTVDENVVMIANMPESFAVRKSAYVRMGQGQLQSNLHPQSHYAQIRAALEAVGA